MNNASSFQFGWAAFFVCTVGGAYVGYQQAVVGREKRAAALAGQVKQRNDSLDRLEAKMRAEGSRHFKLPSAAIPAVEREKKKKNPP